VQPLNWYVRRLRAMSPAEIGWRLHAVARNAIDRLRFPLIRRSAERCAWRDEFTPDEPGFRVCDLPVGAWSGAAAESAEGRWRDSLLAIASDAAAGRLSFFDRRCAALGYPIDWNRDVKSGMRAPLRFAPSLDYRDTRVVGDCKFVWEPNRHHHLVVLGRAYRASGQERFATAVVAQIEQWLDACPFGLGMNWRSGLELGVRLINWVWALDLVQPSGKPAGALLDRILRSVELHVWEIRRKYSRGSSANNHVIGEAAGVYVAASYFCGLPARESIRAEARQILCEEFLRQSDQDGGSREQAFGYQIFVLGLVLAAVTAARATGDEFPPEFYARLEKFLGFLNEMSPNGRPLALYGDADDGYVLDLNGRPREVATLLNWGAVVMDLGSERSGPTDELATWLPKAAKSPRGRAVAQRAVQSARCSRHFPQTGLAVLTYQNPASPFDTTVLFDCGPLGYGAIAAHGHADALSVVLRAFGEDVLIDPGTFDYFTYPGWRKYFRSTRAHNTLEVDGLDQSEMLGPFLWGRRAETRLLRWAPTDDGGQVHAQHDGYERLSDPVIHRRAVELRGHTGQIFIEDEVIAHKSHGLGLYFHVGHRCQVVRRDTHGVAIETVRGAVELRLDPRLSVSIAEGSEDPISGWVSEGYHRKSPTATIVGRCTIQGRILLRTEILLSCGGRVRHDTPKAVSHASSAVSAA
jgi:hypothetical protein